MVRPKDSTGKFAPYAAVTLPGHDNPSAKASKPALDHRSKELMKVLDILSSREKATEEDLVATLGHFFKKNQTLVKKAIKKAELNLYRELTPQETLDLKLLLRMTWSKFNMLRTYLSNKDVGVLASEPSMRKELKSRRNFTEETTEVGTKVMKKTVNAKPTKVSYVRTKDLQHHIEELLKKHLAAGNTWHDDKFLGEIWIKIGGDKGGSSTKLAVQIVNVKNPNSPDNTDLIAFFEATDSDENMRLIFSIYTQILLDMQEPGFVLRLGSDFGNMSCRIFIFGDYEFLCKSLGHSSASSTYPCLWCLVTRDQLRNHRGQPHCPKEKDERGFWVDRDGWPEDRTVESMLMDLQNNREFTAARGGTMKTNFSRFHSMHTDAILPLNPDKGLDHIVPPILHIMLGLVQRFFGFLEVVCRDIDNGAGNFEGRDLYNTWETESENTQAKEKKWEAEKAELAMQELLLEGFKKSSRGNEEGGAAPPCEMPACALAAVNPWTGQRRVNDRVKWLRCSQCGDQGWFHLSCVGLGLSEYEDDAFDFICPLCEGNIDSAADTVRMQVRRVEKQKKVVKKAKDEYEKSKKELENVFNQISKEMGTKEKELNRVLEDDLHVRRQAYHSQCFVGNHCKVILAQHKKLVAVLDGHEEQEKYNLLFAKLHAIFSYTEARFLEQHEVDDVVDKCYDFGVWFPANFANETIPPKLHMLVCAVPKCVRAWYTLGLLSEHGLEGIHAQVNADDRIYCRVRDNESRLSLVFKHHSHYSTADKSALKTMKRRCQSWNTNKEQCKGRYYTVGNVRQCNICYLRPEDVND